MISPSFGCVMRSSVETTILDRNEQLQELAELLARGVLRLRTRILPAICHPEALPESACLDLDVPADAVLSVLSG